MADINAVDLPKETVSTLEGNECLVGFDSAEGKQIAIHDLVEYIYSKSKGSFSGNKTLNENMVNIMSQVGAISMNSRTFTASAENSTLYARYPYSQRVSAPSSKDAGFVDIALESGEYKGFIGLEQSEKLVTVYFSEKPTPGTSFRLYTLGRN